jgi:polyisoprenyl-phosphate glycosyltransferase
MSISPRTSVVLPAKNEAAGIENAVAVIGGVLERSDPAWEILVVDDGSTDKTWDVLGRLSQRDARIRGVRLSRNFGKEAALLAGLRHARGERVITMDADLQHPPELIPQMIHQWESGAKVVHAVKHSRTKDSRIARWRANLFNTIVSRLGGIELRDSSDFKLLDREVVDAIVRQLPERERFYRGLADWVGFRSAHLPFSVDERAAGVGQWSIWRLSQLAMTALVSFTSAPLRIVTVLGFLTLLLGFIVGVDAVISRWHGIAVSGFATTIIVLLIVGSFIMISLGIIGEYIAKIYEEVKARPPYFVEDTTDSPDASL